MLRMYATRTSLGICNFSLGVQKHFIFQPRYIYHKMPTIWTYEDVCGEGGFVGAVDVVEQHHVWQPHCVVWHSKVRDALIHLGRIRHALIVPVNNSTCGDTLVVPANNIKMGRLMKFSCIGFVIERFEV